MYKYVLNYSHLTEGIPEITFELVLITPII
jgi:hypothetical protein